MTKHIDGLFSYELESKCNQSPDQEIVVFENNQHPDEPLTYEQIFLNGCKIAAYLQKQGIGKGDSFCLVMRNHPEFLYALLAASLVGAIVVPIDPRSKGGKLAYQLQDSGAKGIFYANEFSTQVKEAMAQLGESNRVTPLGVLYKQGFSDPEDKTLPNMNEILSGPECPPPENRNQDLASPFEIIYTSGTTGNPKGVIIKSDRMPMFKLLAQFVWQYTEKDVLYTGLSLTHGNAQAVTLVPSLMLGIKSVISRQFTKSRLWAICRKHKATTFSLLGGMMMGLYSEPPRPDDADNPVQVVLSAGTPRAIWRAFEERFGVKIHEWYGAVEGGFAHNPPGVGPVGSFGKPLDGVMEMKIVHEDDSECAPGEIGEIICRPAQGKAEVQYLGKQEASAKKTRGGWLRTGDMGHRDENGWFYFDFRKGGGLRRQGDFIQPEYIEKILAEQPEISDVCVYGIPAQSGAPGESDLVAALVPFPGKTIDPQKVYRVLEQALEKNSIPSYLQIVQEIPKTASQKNLDRILREEFDPDRDNVYAYR